MDDTHDPQRRSWVESANQPDTAFPIQNLPFGIFAGQNGPTVGVAIGDRILDLRGCAGLLGPAASACAASTLNPLMALGHDAWTQLRAELSDLLRADHPQAADHQRALRPHLLAMSEATMLKPAHIGGFTDFYSSMYHATNVGRLFRPENPLLPNYKYVPIGYTGRTSSIVVGGSRVKRPSGQSISEPEAPPHFGPTRSLDYEMEVGFFVGPGNELGETIAIEDAVQRIFGICLLNDWSARDIQAWEYRPLGPFLAKNFATTLSPWVVTMDALAPFRVPAAVHDLPPLPYLHSGEDQRQGGIDVILEVYLKTPQMREPARLSRCNLRHFYWTPAQLLTHHASNGCNLQPGDLLGSGTVSGPEDENRGCLLEITQNGREPVTLPTGERRTFLEDGDQVTLRGHCERRGFVSIGLGECSGTIVE
jgi:fumarylacetoacetase